MDKGNRCVCHGWSSAKQLEVAPSAGGPTGTEAVLNASSGAQPALPTLSRHKSCPGFIFLTTKREEKMLRLVCSAVCSVPNGPGSYLLCPPVSTMTREGERPAKIAEFSCLNKKDNAISYWGVRVKVTYSCLSFSICETRILDY